jgi:hypothetical protein
VTNVVTDLPPFFGPVDMKEAQRLC